MVKASPKQTQDANTWSIDNFKPNSSCLARLKVTYNRVMDKKNVREPQLDLAILTISNLKQSSGKHPPYSTKVSFKCFANSTRRLAELLHFDISFSLWIKRCHLVMWQQRHVLYLQHHWLCQINMDNSRLLLFPFKILLCLGLILFLAYETNFVWERNVRAIAHLRFQEILRGNSHSQSKKNVCSSTLISWLLRKYCQDTGKIFLTIIILLHRH